MARTYCFSISLMLTTRRQVGHSRPVEELWPGAVAVDDVQFHFVVDSFELAEEFGLEGKMLSSLLDGTDGGAEVVGYGRPAEDVDSCGGERLEALEDGVGVVAICRLEPLGGLAEDALHVAAAVAVERAFGEAEGARDQAVGRLRDDQPVDLASVGMAASGAGLHHAYRRLVRVSVLALHLLVCASSCISRRLMAFYINPL